MKTKLNLEIEATPEEVKGFLVDLAFRAGAKYVREIPVGVFSETLRSAMSTMASFDAQRKHAPCFDDEPIIPTDTSAQPRLAKEPAFYISPVRCGDARSDDTVQGSIWQPCSKDPEAVAVIGSFGNRGRVARAVCGDHRGAFPPDVALTYEPLS